MTQLRLHLLSATFFPVNRVNEKTTSEAQNISNMIGTLKQLNTSVFPLECYSLAKILSILKQEAETQQMIPCL